MITLSAFADEIAPELETQVEVLLSLDIHGLELRGVWGKNVLDLTDDEVAEVGRYLQAQGIAVTSIGSPIGKVPIDTPAEESLTRFKRALQVALTLYSPYIRLFSFYPPSHSQSWEGMVERYRDEVVQRLTSYTALAQQYGIVLLHENEKEIYGDTTERCLDLLTAIDSPAFRAAFDPANFIQCGVEPYPTAFEALQPWISYVHVKDADAQGQVTVAGAGQGQWPALIERLQAAGYNGVFSLEPHLAAAGAFSGFSGPDLFKEAVLALRHLLPDGYEQRSAS